MLSRKNEVKMASIDLYIDNLRKICSEQREHMVLANRMMKEGTLRSGSSRDGSTWIDETPDRIKENERQIAQLDEALAEMPSGKP
jgi:hypothetical protein